MGILKYLKSFLANDSNVTTIPEGYCPNCWGRQEFGGQFYNSVKAEGINTNNIESKKGWVQAYAEKNLIGIQLKEDDAQLVCNSCKVRYELN